MTAEAAPAEADALAPQPRGWIGVVRQSRVARAIPPPAELLPPAPRAEWRWTWPATIVAMLIAGGALLAARSDPAPWNMVWAEDGPIFLGQARTEGAWSATTTPYNGYLHVTARIAGAVIVQFPTTWWAMLAALAAIAVRVGIAVIAYHALAGVLRFRLPRIFAAMLVVAIPIGSYETLNNLANMQWFLVYGSAVCLIWRPARTWQVVTGCAVIALAGLSSPLTAALAPIWILRMAATRCWRDAAAPIAFVLAGLLQAIPILTADRPTTGAGLAAGAEGYVQRVLVSGLLGVEPTERLGARWGWAGLAVPAALVLAFVLIAIVYGRTSRRWLAVAFATSSVLLWGTEMTKSGPLGVDVHHLNLVPVGRYAIIPTLLIATAALAGLDRMLEEKAALRWTAVGLAAVALVTLSNGFVSAARHSAGALTSPDVPSWPAAVRDARQACADGATEYTVAIQPVWNMTIPCRPDDRWSTAHE